MESYDLFKIDTSGKPMWLGPAETLDEAKVRARKERASDGDCEFCVSDRKTGRIVNISRQELA